MFEKSFVLFFKFSFFPIGRSTVPMGGRAISADKEENIVRHFFYQTIYSIRMLL